MTTPLLLCVAVLCALAWLVWESAPRPRHTVIAALPWLSLGLVVAVWAMKAAEAKAKVDEAQREADDLDERTRRLNAQLEESRRVIAEAQAQLERLGG